MERVRTMTISNWHALAENSLTEDNDDNDRFFESFDRISAFSAADLDGAAASPPSSSSSGDDHFDDCRLSFASAVSSAGRSSNKFHSFSADLYDVWMAAPGSITERRNRLLQGMGLANERRLPVSREGHRGPNQEQPLPPPRQPSTPPSPSPATVPRSRSDSDIESFSADEKRRLEILGSSKQSLARTRSAATSVAEAGHTVAALKEWASASSSSSSDGRLMSAAGRYGAFFLIKNLDTGKEFVVNEYGDDGGWNRLSDLQTGKQLTLEEFEKCVGFSPVVKELMRRENVGGTTTTAGGEIRKGGGFGVNSLIYKSLRTSKRRGVALIKSGIKSVSGLIHDHKLPPPPLLLPPPPAPEQEVSKGNNNSSSPPSSGWIKTRQSGKSHKELSALHLCQEIQAHEGSIWAIKFSSDARFLASAGEDRVVQVWEVQECEVMEANGGGGGGVTATPLHPAAVGAEEKKSKKGNKGSSGRRSSSNSIPDYVHVSETVFALSDKPVCSFEGHLDDVLDLSWSSSQLLLSSSMDKTVRLWDLESKACLKLFAHNDYVTCIQFNPRNDDYFISGSLDAKVRIWSIPDRQVVDWTDFHEMVTAACYTPDGQGAFIGSHKGHIRIYSAQDCKLSQTGQLDLQSKKKSHAKKITGFQFSPVNPTQVLVTSADSRVRILDGQNIVHKFKGFRNTSSQIAASFSQDGKYVISASEDSQVYVWKRDDHNHQQRQGASKRSQVNTRSFEQFQCRDVSVAIPWPGTVRGEPPQHSRGLSKRGGSSSACASPTGKRHHLPPLPKKPSSDDAPEEDQPESSSSGGGESFSSLRYGDSPSWSWFDGGGGTGTGTHAVQATAWGMVVVTAGLGGEIRAYQNFGIPRKVGRQTSLFGGPT